MGYPEPLRIPGRLHLEDVLDGELVETTARDREGIEEGLSADEQGIAAGGVERVAIQREEDETENVSLIALTPGAHEKAGFELHIIGVLGELDDDAGLMRSVKDMDLETIVK